MTDHAALSGVLASQAGFIQSFLRIKDKQGRIVPLVFNRPQRLFRERRQRFSYVLKARKLGISLDEIASTIHDCATKPRQHAVLIAHTDEDVGVMFEEKVKPMILNSRLPINCKVYDTGKVHFLDTDSWYRIGSAGSIRFGRSKDITRYHASEYAHWTKPDVLTAVEEACVDNAVGLVETTANGQNHAKVLWDRCKRGEGRYRAIFLPWYADEHYSLPGTDLGVISEEEQKLIEAFHLDAGQIAWRRKKLSEMNQPDLFPQEYPATDAEAFLSSGRAVFDWLALLKHETQVREPRWRGSLRDLGDRIEFNPEDRGPLSIWEPPKDLHQYFIGADVAEGIADGAYSCGYVLDLNDSEVVAAWHGRCAPDLFGDHLAELGRYYKNATISVERWPGPGEVTQVRLQQMRYPRLWQGAEDAEPGWQTNAKSKTEMVLDLAGGLRELRFTIHDAEGLAELRAYVYDAVDRGGRLIGMGPSAGAFADRVMALAIAWHCSRTLSEAAQRQSVIQRHPFLSESLPSSGGTSVPRFRGPRIGVRS